MREVPVPVGLDAVALERGGDEAPRHEGGHVHAALPVVALAPAEGPVDGAVGRQPAVVGEEHHHGVVPFAQLFQQGAQCAETVVDLREHTAEKRERDQKKWWGGVRTALQNPNA